MCLLGKEVLSFQACAYTCDWCRLFLQVWWFLKLFSVKHNCIGMLISNESTWSAAACCCFWYTWNFTSVTTEIELIYTHLMLDYLNYWMVHANLTLNMETNSVVWNHIALIGANWSDFALFTFRPQFWRNCLFKLRTTVTNEKYLKV